MAFTGMDDVMRKLLTRTDVHKQLGAVIPGTVEFLVPILHDGEIEQIGLVAATSPDQGAGAYTCAIKNETSDLDLVDGGGPINLHGIAPAVMVDVGIAKANAKVSVGDVIKFTVDVTDGGASGGDDLQAVIEYRKAMKE